MLSKCAPCLCVQEEDELATKQNNAKPEGRAAEADTIKPATPADGSQQGGADPRYVQPLMGFPPNLQQWVAWPWPQRLTLCRHPQHLTGPFALGLTASLTSSARRLRQPGPMACHTPECIRREATSADWELAVTATQEELAVAATQEELAVLNEHASEPWEATPAATDQLEDEDMLDAGSE